MSKGSGRRPAAVTPEEYARNWERAFLERKGREAMDEHTRLWNDEIGDPYRTYPAREEQQREDGATEPDA